MIIDFRAWSLGFGDLGFKVWSLRFRDWSFGGPCALRV